MRQPLTPGGPAASAAEPSFGWRRSAAYGALIVFVLLGLAELTLRLVGVRQPPSPRLLLRSLDVDITFPFVRPDPELFWSLKPGFRGTFLGEAVTVNQLGTRGPEIRPKHVTGRRVVCFGDSITFGYGVGDDQTFAAALGRLLSDRNFDVVNAGVTGYTSEQVRAWARRLLPRLDADLALISIGWNDSTLRAVSDRQYAEHLRAAMKVDDAMDWLFLYRGIKSLYLRARVRHIVPVDGATVEWTVPRVPLDQYRENLLAIVGECRSRGAQPIFVALPCRRQAGAAPPKLAYPDAFRAIGREAGVTVISPGDLACRADVPVNDASFIDSLHLSVSGNERMAREIAHALQAQGVVPAPTRQGAAGR